MPVWPMVRLRFLPWAHDGAAIVAPTTDMARVWLNVLRSIARVGIGHLLEVVK